jgi:hypothetical protein
MAAMHEFADLLEKAEKALADPDQSHE